MFIRVFASVLATAASIFAMSARAETIEFPEEELATESVLPVFDKTVVVRQRAVTLTGRFEVGLGGGLNLTEPLYSQTVFNGQATYHFDETNAVNLYFMHLSDSLSQAGNDLAAGKGLAKDVYFDASLAPRVQNMLFANYQLTAYYGKLSLTKQTTMNLSLYAIGGLGLVQWTDTNTFGADLGIGQKLYFTPNFGLRADLFFAMYPGADPTNYKPGGNLGGPGFTGGQQKSSQFGSTFYFRPFMTVDFIYLF